MKEVNSQLWLFSTFLGLRETANRVQCVTKSITRRESVHVLAIQASRSMEAKTGLEALRHDGSANHRHDIG